MSSLLNNAIVRIQKENREIVGTGCLVGDDLVLTCAHVVRDALGLPTTPVEKPDRNVHLVFPFTDPKKTFTAEIIVWKPGDTTRRTDVAGLKLLGYPPHESRPLQITGSNLEEINGHQIKFYGFPSGYDSGTWADGSVQDARSDGLIQLVDRQANGIKVRGGFSGAPVWDETLRKVIGIISTADNSTESRVAFMVPSTAIISEWRTLETETVTATEVDVPVVVIAMTHSEATTLFRQVTNSEPNIKFQTFRDIISSDEVENWIEHYKYERDDWHPHTHMDNSIRQFIQEITDEVNYHSSVKGSKTSIRPKFLTREFFSEDKHVQDEAWDELTTSGGVAIIDAISLFHENIR